MKNIIWISSYPKSGNTWLRIFLNNLESDEKKTPVCLNQLNKIKLLHASGRSYLDETLGYNSSYLNERELQKVQKKAYIHIGSRLNKDTYFKNHSAYRIDASSDPLFPKNVTKAAIYIIRNPLEITCSYANHNNRSINAIIKDMNNPSHKLAHIKAKP